MKLFKLLFIGLIVFILTGCYTSLETSKEVYPQDTYRYNSYRYLWNGSWYFKHIIYNSYWDSYWHEYPYTLHYLNNRYKKHPRINLILRNSDKHYTKNINYSKNNKLNRNISDKKIKDVYKQPEIKRNTSKNTIIDRKSVKHNTDIHNKIKQNNKIKKSK